MWITFKNLLYGTFRHSEEQRVVMTFSCVLSLGEWKDGDMGVPLGATMGATFWTTCLVRRAVASVQLCEGLENTQWGK